MYFALKTVHLATVVGALFSLFFVSYLGWLAPERLRQPAVQRLTLANNGLLLASALALMWASGQYPFAQGWLTAKLLGFVAYIVLARVAMAPAVSTPLRAPAVAGSLACLIYIAWVARAHSATPWAI
ncbi:MAG: SirB2 family protein [Gammaproteobacteria bacterium]|nr:SirB2 family protein [Gammaproteobacteria bacterium]